ncbi:septum formation initiator family protein [Treponema sp. TIM-1]|uniref:septum formation initiator family protein n=1 Tax=Treponema sp. TIM-1 TaxID=2898417 RepID=UPI00397F19B6
MKRRVVLYLVTLTIPLLLGLTVWQATRYAELEQEVKDLEAIQEEWIESNKRLIMEIAVLSSPERIAYIAEYELGLSKKQPEEVLQVRIKGTTHTDG